MQPAISTKEDLMKHLNEATKQWKMNMVQVNIMEALAHDYYHTSWYNRITLEI